MRSAAPSRAIASVPHASWHDTRITKRSKRFHRDHSDDGEHSTSLDINNMEVASADDAGNDVVDGDDDGDGAEVVALVGKLREGQDRRQNAAADSLSQESTLSLPQQMLDVAHTLAASTISGQTTSLVSNSTPMMMMSYYMRAIFTHRAKLCSQKCYKRLARDSLVVKSPADKPVYSALYEHVQQHYPGLASTAAGVETRLEHPIFTVDATLQRFKEAMAPCQDWHCSSGGGGVQRQPAWQTVNRA